MLRKFLTDLINGRALGSGKWALASALEHDQRDKQIPIETEYEKYQREREIKRKEQAERWEIESRRLEVERRKQYNKVVEAATAIFTRNAEPIEKFLAIAETKVSILDEYGDENWDALPDEIKVCLKKIANRERLSVDWKRFDPQIARQLRNNEGSSWDIEKEWRNSWQKSRRGEFIPLDIFWLFISFTTCWKTVLKNIIQLNAMIPLLPLMQRD